mgnify:CR=1 FL=1
MIAFPDLSIFSSAQLLWNYLCSFIIYLFYYYASEWWWSCSTRLMWSGFPVPTDFLRDVLNSKHPFKMAQFFKLPSIFHSRFTLERNRDFDLYDKKGATNLSSRFWIQHIVSLCIFSYSRFFTDVVYMWRKNKNEIKRNNFTLFVEPVGNNLGGSWRKVISAKVHLEHVHSHCDANIFPES